MEHITSVLGVDFLHTSARGAVMKRPRPRQVRSLASFLPHCCDSMLLLRKAKSSLDDDDTMSTMSSSDSSFASRAYSVSFAEPLVTATHSRPRTTPEEKTRLFYTDADYREFRHAYMYGRRPRRRVLFAAALVSDVRVYAEEGAKASLYYSDEDLQRFLDEFVESLNEGSSP